MALDRSISRKTLAMFSTPMVGAALFFGVSSLEADATTAPATVTQRVSTAVLSPAPFPTNANGQTYGSAAGVGFAQEPDLISAIGAGLNGTGHVTGYVLKSQLNAVTGANVSTPAQAAAWTEAHSGSNAPPVSIPLYAQDGTTVVGNFTVEPGSAPTITAGTTTSP